MAKIVGIAIKTATRAEMELKDNCWVTYLDGIIGDHQGSRTAGSESSKRQVTVLSEEQWDATCVELGIKIPWHARRAQLCVSGMIFGPADVGRYLIVNGTALLEITGETTPCERMDEIFPGLRAALAKDWRGGVTCRVIESKLIRVGDIVVF